MAERPSWLERNRRILIGACLAIIVLELALLGYFANWTGFAGKTLWEWLDLLIVPAVIAVGAYWLNRQERQAEREAEKRRAETEREIAAERERENALQAYLDRMTELMLNGQLRTSESSSDVRDVARACTLTVLRTLDSKRKGFLLRFLYESDLIDNNEAGPIVCLSGADLSRAELGWAGLKQADLHASVMKEVNLSHSFLSKANLRLVKLCGAKLESAFLRDADLRGTDLHNANLHWADLRGADLRRASLRDANLNESKLEDTDLSWANLRCAEVTDEQLAQTKSLRGATMPDGNRYDGRFNLEGDVEAARKEGVDVDDS